MRLAFFEGTYIKEEQAKVNISTLGFSLGASVFEACRVNYNKENDTYFLFRIKDHICRLFQSMKIMRMLSPYSQEQLLECVVSLVKKWNMKTDGYIKIMAYISSPSPGSSVFHPDDVTTDICAIISPSNWPREMQSGIHVCVSSWTRIRDNGMPPRVKSVCNYENTRLAGYEAILNGYDNAIMLNNQGKVSEAAESAIFLVDGNTIVTPNVTSDILNSITRNTIIANCMGKFDIEERVVDRSELYLASEIFLCNTAKLIRPVLSVDKIVIGNGEVGKVTKEVQSDYKKVAYGYDKDYLHRSIVV